MGGRGEGREVGEDRGRERKKVEGIGGSWRGGVGGGRKGRLEERDLKGEGKGGGWWGRGIKERGGGRGGEEFEVVGEREMRLRYEEGRGGRGERGGC